MDFDGPCSLDDCTDDEVVPEISIFNKDECLETLSATMDPLHPSVDYGLDLYCSAVNIIESIAQQ